MQTMGKSSLVATILASSLLVHGMLAGCSANRELLDAPLPQSYFLPNPPSRVWDAVRREALKPNRRILAKDEAAYLLSWLTDVEPNERLHASLTDPDVGSEPDETIAIAVVQVEAAPGGSKLTARLTYYSPSPFVGVSSSRGNYEQEVLRAIRNWLLSEVGDHAAKR